MQLGIVGYVREVERAVRTALRTSRRILNRTARSLRRSDPAGQQAVFDVRAAVDEAERRLDRKEPVALVTYDFQQAVSRASRSVVDRDMAAIRADLAVLEDLPIEIDQEVALPVIDEAALQQLAERDWSPLGAVRSVQQLMRAVDVDRSDEAQPIMPLATLSVTEDMATSMRLHGTGWRSVFHHEILAKGLAPDDLATMLKQRLRWAQGTLQVMLKENPLVQRGMSVGQRLMYFATMWSYLSGFAALPLLLAPVIYLCFGVLPVHAYGLTFLGFFAPYFLLNQALFLVVGYGYRTWRGQQYSLALFPVWIRAVVTAVLNVYFGRGLGFVVTQKTRSGQPPRFPWRLIWPQLATFALFLVATVIGLIRLLSGTDATYVGTFVNLCWVAYDVVVMSVVIQAALYRPAEPEQPAITEEARP
jgi:cellulose synthase (UDP-forming)